EMAAPGLEKGDFKINLDHDALTISSEKTIDEVSRDPDRRFTRKEFSYQSFCRSFSLPVNVDSDKISAKYENGILRISIPKKELARPRTTKEIEIL
ncbi:MAG: Hsp20/alpha crystallin family protein, partial [Bacteroidota bacterium]|nr:Hsp20/alpha crystallin family protein [Bacteroidota bacterium]